MKTTDIDIFGGNENILRAFEICHVGGFKMKLINSQDEDNRLSPVQFKSLNIHLDNHTTDDPTYAMLLEVVKPELRSIIPHRHQETKMEVIARANDLKKEAGDNLPEQINEAGMALLKTAYERLDFMPYEVAMIVDWAAVIAIMENPKAKEIGVHHLAEAIQYRSLERELREPLNIQI